MSERTLTVNVAQARARLAELRRGISAVRATAPPEESLAAIDEIQGVLDKLVSRHVLLREILHRTSDIMLTKDRQGRYTMINENGAQMLGRTVGEVLGLDDRELYPAGLAAEIMASDREVMSTGRPTTRELTHEVGGVWSHVIMTTTTWYDDRGDVQGVIGIAHDVTALHAERLHADLERRRLRAMSGEMILREEELRQALAGELQNGLGQELALAKLKLAVLRTAADAKLREALVAIEALVEQADRSLHAITFQICPPSLHDLGLVPALSWLAEEVERKYGLVVTVVDEAAPGVVDGRARLFLFRSVRELLVGAADRATTARVEVRPGVEPDRVEVRVRGVGIGGDPGESEPRSAGFFELREQMLFIGGDLEFVSQSDDESVVSLTAPCTPGVPGAASEDHVEV